MCEQSHIQNAPKGKQGANGAGCVENGDASGTHEVAMSEPGDVVATAELHGATTMSEHTVAYTNVAAAAVAGGSSERSLHPRGNSIQRLLADLGQLRGPNYRWSMPLSRFSMRCPGQCLLTATSAFFRCTESML